MRVRQRFWPEATIAVLSGFLAILTVAWPDWIEGLTGFSPDNHNGSAEVYITFAFAMAAIILAAVARIEWRRSRAALAQG